MDLLNTNGFNALKKAKHGYILYNKNDRYIGRSIAIYGEFSELEIALFSQICKEGSIVIEAGANIGTHTLRLSQLVGKSGKVYAFEPQTIVFQTLCANMALNSVLNVETYQMALGDENGSIMIPNIDYETLNNFGGIELENIKRGKQVPKVKLDDTLKLNRLDFIKIDVEGMEKQVIDGATNLIKKFKPILYVENDRVKKSKDLIKTIFGLGYDIYKHNPPLFNPNNYENNKENIFGNIISKNLLCIHKTSKIKLKGFEKIKL